MSRDCFHQSPPFPIITAQSVDNYLVMLQKGKKENHKSSVKKEFFFFKVNTNMHVLTLFESLKLSVQIFKLLFVRSFRC